MIEVIAVGNTQCFIMYHTHTYCILSQYIYYLAKPQEFEEQEYDLKDPDSLYFIYVLCKKSADLVARKKEAKKGRKKK